jgi:5-hydroxyisourate hydrolase
VVLQRLGDAPTAVLARGTTDGDGRVKGFTPTPVLKRGGYRLTFEVAPYFASSGVDAFYARVVVEFEVRDPSQHYHVPLLLSPFGYSTYRGS